MFSVTTVGATQGFNPEVAAMDTSFDPPFYSGGGFSNYFPAPSYQKSTVSAYVKSLGNQYQGLYNPNGRGYPDVSAQGAHFKIAWAGAATNFTTVSGTSASTPLFAGIVALLNE
jgi:tripeptidyl-peptidase-1